MTATNHALTGAVIAAALPAPLLAIPLALASHIAIDALPHFGDDAEEFSSRKFKYMLFIDLLICIAIAAIILAFRPEHWFLLITCAFIATAPDILWLPDFIAAHKGKPMPKYGKIRQFLSDVQWSQKPVGIIVEILWFGALFSILVAYALLN
jgi:hypothetical protein